MGELSSISKISILDIDLSIQKDTAGGKRVAESNRKATQVSLEMVERALNKECYTYLNG